ncbi:MAG: right-handed parallel beta-helix repeat-containing protein, partial [Spirochaetaceae bacterium]|nr:right-handed parallel beta-helix repeat-containing protein [Spirochaetaceae bacterium]
MKKSIFILFISIIILFLLTCDIYNKSIPEYLDQYTNSASVAEHTFTDGTLLNPQNQVYSGLIKPDSVIDLKLRNPKNYQLVSYLEYKQGDAWIPFSRVESPGDYSTVEYTSGDFAGLVITVKYLPTDQIKISIAGATIGEAYRLKLKVNDRETKREFDPYELPELKCTDYPEEIRNLSIAAGSEGNGLRVKWGQSLRNSGYGDRADADNLVISCPSLGIPPETYTRNFDGTSWDEWSRDIVKISRTGDDYSVIIGSHVPLVPGALYNVNLRFKNEAGVVREISKSLTGDPYCVRVTIGDAPTLYTTLDKAFEYIDDQMATKATVTILNDIDDQGTIIIPSGKEITVISEGANTIQLGSKGCLFNIMGTLKLGGVTSPSTITLKGISGNTDALLDVNGGTLELYDKAVITGNNSGSGAGVYVSSGNFKMDGGVIEGNSANSGGGVIVYDYGATFTMTGGTIRGNEASNGGGVSIFLGTFNMDGGTIENNTANSNGGGVY